MRNPPTFKYAGLTIVLSNPSRFDLRHLMTGAAGDWFNDYCLSPGCNRYQCDIRTKDTLGAGFLPNTKCLLILGEDAAKELLNINGSIHAHRGSPYHFQDIAAIPSYLPQDCTDPKDYESTHNPLLQGKEDSEEDDEDESTEKDRSKTQRSSWRFWLERDTKKALKIIRKYDGNIPIHPKHKEVLYPSLEPTCKLLRETKGETIYLDIETDFSRQLTCVGFNFTSSDTVFVVPCCLCDYTRAYGNLPYFLASLAVALRDNEVVCHNSMFDLFVLAHHYGIPIGRRIYDTMLAQHRCFPETEKSLGHCISLWLYLPYHKDEGIFAPKSREQEERLWRYNAKDVWTMRLIREAIDEYAGGHPGLKESIAQANASVRPYLINTLMGIHYNEDRRKGLLDNNDKLMTQHLRILRYLVGHEFLPTSPKQCVKYFHEEMDYPIVARTPTGNPCLNEKAMQKLKLKMVNNQIMNPVMDYCLLFRKSSKQAGTLKFTPWKSLPESQENGLTSIPMLQ